MQLTKSLYFPLIITFIFVKTDALSLRTTTQDSPTTIHDVTTQRPATTTPTSTPTPSSCCSFESDVCNYGLFKWYWSSDNVTTQVPSFDGNYVWTNFYNSELISNWQYSVDSNTVFDLSYYINDSSVYLGVFFQLPNGIRNLITTLSYDKGQWQTISLTNYNYCSSGGSVCDGQLVIISNGVGAPFMAAVDDISRDDKCKIPSPYCCDFSNDKLCGYTSTTELGYSWEFYPSDKPTTNIPDPGSSYVFMETVDFMDTTPLYITLMSEAITITSETVFEGTIFASSEASAENALMVNFRNQATGETTNLNYASDTSGYWLSLPFYCTSGHGSCCQGATNCTGYIELTAYVGASGGSAIFGVDEFHIVGQCDTTTSSISNSIKLLPQRIHKYIKN